MSYATYGLFFSRIGLASSRTLRPLLTSQSLLGPNRHPTMVNQHQRNFMTMYLFGRTHARRPTLTQTQTRAFRASQVLNNKDFYKTLNVSRSAN